MRGSIGSTFKKVASPLMGAFGQSVAMPFKPDNILRNFGADREPPSGYDTPQA